MKLITLNIAGIQNLVKHKLLVDYLINNDFDIVCLQEVSFHQ